MATNFAKTLLDLEQLLGSIQQHQDLAPSATRFREPLEAAIVSIRATNARQNTLKADRQKATQDLKAGLAAAKDLAIDVRAVIRGEVGARSEKLVQFGIGPLRPRARKAKPGEGTETAKSKR